MKRLALLFAVLSLAFAPVLMSGVAVADPGVGVGTCQIGFTGPDSNNICTSEQQYTCSVVNNNLTVLNQTNTQSAYSGSISLVGNGSGGTSQTGSATNDNGVTFNVTVTNTAPCTVVATVLAQPPIIPPAVVTSTKPTPAKPAVKPAVLPNTAAESPLTIVAVLVGILGTSALVSRLAVTLYGHVKA